MATPVDCAKVVLDTVPLVMRNIRSMIRSHRTPDLSVPQFRILLYISRHPDASLSEVAEYIGLTLPTLSKMVDLLVSREWVARNPCPEDRRRLQLGLTERGKAMLEQAQDSTRASLAKCFEDIPPEKLEQIAQAMQQLHLVFSDPSTDQFTTG